MDEIDTSQLEPKLRAELEKNGLLSCRKILLSDDFLRLGNFTPAEISQVKTLAAQSLISHPFKTVSEAKILYKRKWRNIIFDCGAIDEITGGIPTRGITEIYGKSGSGKTQICLQISLTVQYPEEHGGLGLSAVYICTEDRFPSQRLQQMVPAFPRKFSFANQFADRIYVDHLPDVEALKECLFKRLPTLLSRNNIGVVIIDSIAAVFRSDYEPKEYNTRTKNMRLIGSQLHHLSRKHNIAVLCVNQVADAIEAEETVPALGLVWSNLVTNRFQVSFQETRTFKVIFSPHLPTKECNFDISTEGIVDK